MYKILIICWFLVGCSQSPDFSAPVEVMEKETSEGISKYTLRRTQGNRGSWLGPVVFNAPDEFANVGDVLVFHRGAIRVKKETWK